MIDNQKEVLFITVKFDYKGEEFTKVISVTEEAIKDDSGLVDIKEEIASQVSASTKRMYMEVVEGISIDEYREMMRQKAIEYIKTKRKDD